MMSPDKDVLGAANGLLTLASICRARLQTMSPSIAVFSRSAVQTNSSSETISINPTTASSSSNSLPSASSQSNGVPPPPNLLSSLATSTSPSLLSSSSSSFIPEVPCNTATSSSSLSPSPSSTSSVPKQTENQQLHNSTATNLHSGDTAKHTSPIKASIMTSFTHPNATQILHNADIPPPASSSTSTTKTSPGIITSYTSTNQTKDSAITSSAIVPSGAKPEPPPNPISAMSKNGNSSIQQHQPQKLAQHPPSNGFSSTSASFTSSLSAPPPHQTSIFTPNSTSSPTSSSSCSIPVTLNAMIPIPAPIALDSLPNGSGAVAPSTEGPSTASSGLFSLTQRLLTAPRDEVEMTVSQLCATAIVGGSSSSPSSSNSSPAPTRRNTSSADRRTPATQRKPRARRGANNANGAGSAGGSTASANGGRAPRGSRRTHAQTTEGPSTSNGDSNDGQPRPKKKAYVPSYVQEGEKCVVCGDASTGTHYRAMTCEGCKGFFRRTVQNKGYLKFVCKKENNCEINQETRNACQRCRYRRCIEAKMSTESVLSETEREQLRCLILSNRAERQKQLSQILTLEEADLILKIGEKFKSPDVKDFYVFLEHMYDDSLPAPQSSDLSPSVKHVMDFISAIPGMEQIPCKDSMTLAHHHILDIVGLRMAEIFDKNRNALVFSNRILAESDLKRFPWMERIFKFCKRNAEFVDADGSVLGCLAAVRFLCTDNIRVENETVIDSVLDNINHILIKYLQQEKISNVHLMYTSLCNFENIRQEDGVILCRLAMMDTFTPALTALAQANATPRLSSPTQLLELASSIFTLGVNQVPQLASAAASASVTKSLSNLTMFDLTNSSSSSHSQIPVSSSSFSSSSSSSSSSASSSSSPPPSSSLASVETKSQTPTTSFNGADVKPIKSEDALWTNGKSSLISHHPLSFAADPKSPNFSINHLAKKVDHEAWFTPVTASSNNNDFKLVRNGVTLTLSSITGQPIPKAVDVTLMTNHGLSKHVVTTLSNQFSPIKKDNSVTRNDGAGVNYSQTSTSSALSPSLSSSSSSSSHTRQGSTHNRNGTTHTSGHAPLVNGHLRHPTHSDTKDEESLIGQQQMAICQAGILPNIQRQQKQEEEEEEHQNAPARRPTAFHGKRSGNVPHEPDSNGNGVESGEPQSQNPRASISHLRSINDLHEEDEPMHLQHPSNLVVKTTNGHDLLSKTVHGQSPAQGLFPIHKGVSVPTTQHIEHLKGLNGIASHIFSQQHEKNPKERMLHARRESLAEIEAQQRRRDSLAEFGERRQRNERLHQQNPHLAALITSQHTEPSRKQHEDYLNEMHLAMEENKAKQDFSQENVLKELLQRSAYLERRVRELSGNQVDSSCLDQLKRDEQQHRREIDAILRSQVTQTHQDVDLTSSSLFPPGLSTGRDLHHLPNNRGTPPQNGASRRMDHSLRTILAGGQQNKPANERERIGLHLSRMYSSPTQSPPSTSSLDPHRIPTTHSSQLIHPYPPPPPPQQPHQYSGHDVSTSSIIKALHGPPQFRHVSDDGRQNIAPTPNRTLDLRIGTNYSNNSSSSLSSTVFAASMGKDRELDAATVLTSIGQGSGFSFGLHGLPASFDISDHSNDQAQDLSIASTRRQRHASGELHNSHLLFQRQSHNRATPSAMLSSNDDSNHLHHSYHPPRRTSSFSGVLPEPSLIRRNSGPPSLPFVLRSSATATATATASSTASSTANATSPTSFTNAWEDSSHSTSHQHLHNHHTRQQPSSFSPQTPSPPSEEASSYSHHLHSNVTPRASVTTPENPRRGSFSSSTPSPGGTGSSHRGLKKRWLSRHSTASHADGEGGGASEARKL